VESPLSIKILEGEFLKGDHVIVDSQNGELVFSKKGEDPETPSAEPEDEEKTEMAIS
jgi:hypothetical protein